MDLGWFQTNPSGFRTNPFEGRRWRLKGAQWDPRRSWEGLVAGHSAPCPKTAQDERAHHVRAPKERHADHNASEASHRAPRDARLRERPVRDENAPRKPDRPAVREDLLVRNTWTCATNETSQGNGGARERLEQKDVPGRHGRELLGRRVRTRLRRGRRKQWPGEVFRPKRANTQRAQKRQGQDEEEALVLASSTDGMFESANCDSRRTDAGRRIHDTDSCCTAHILTWMCFSGRAYSE